MLIRRPTDGKTVSFRFYFTNFICKEIGIIFLYIFEGDIHDFITFFIENSNFDKFQLNVLVYSKLSNFLMLLLVLKVLDDYFCFCFPNKCSNFLF